MARFLAHYLFILAAWTLLIKFAMPVAFALAEDVPIDHYIMWDFWWVAHIWLGWALLARPAYTFWLAVAVTVPEIIIVVTKFVLFFQAPEWTIWQSNWFVNKVFVLGVFLMMAWLLLFRREALARRDTAPLSD